MTKDEKLKQCVGCEDNFYNGHNPMGIQECWCLPDARLVTRYKIGTWTRPTDQGAFTKVRVFQCRHEKGQHFYFKLPDFVKESDVHDESVPH